MYSLKVTRMCGVESLRERRFDFFKHHVHHTNTDLPAWL